MSFRLRKSNAYVFALSMVVFVLCASLSKAQQIKNEVKDESRNQADNSLKSVYFSDAASYKRSEAQSIFQKYLGTNGANNKMVFLNSTTTKAGITTDRYTQYINGIKVEHGSFTIVEKAGRVMYISGNSYPYNAALAATPAITETEAFLTAKQFVGATKYMWEDGRAEANLRRITRKADTTYLPKGRLVYVENLKSGKRDHQLRLAYAFDIYAVSPHTRQMVYVDALNRSILFSNSLIKNTAANNRTKYSGVVPFVTSLIGSDYYLYDSTRGNGVYTMSAAYDTTLASTVDITTTTNYWPPTSSDTQAIDAHWGTERIYDYWRTEHGRLSWDNADGMLLSYVHFNNPSTGGGYNNAFWNGSVMVYGDGTGLAAGGMLPLTSLDVAAHEIGHGVCQATCDLLYEYESGAMNEGFSDCWAATIENWANPGEVDRVAKQPWKIGEEIRPGSPLRHMDNPLLASDPATYGGTNWINTSTSACPTPTRSNDYCGVHTNSGVLNHWYYFVVNGGTGTNDLGTAYSVNAIGFTDAAAILYQTELSLSSSDDYVACRVASINAARTLFGACSPQEQSVVSAWHAVGVGSAYTPCTPQIGFNRVSMTLTENANTTACPASRTVNIGLRALGAAITGGSPVASVYVAGGTAVSGTDYTLSSTSLTFTPGDTTTHNAVLTLFDNGTVRDDKTIVLAFTLTTAGSTASMSTTNDTLYIDVKNNDSIPQPGGREYHTLNTGTAATSNFTSAFPGTYRRAHSQYLLDVTEMQAAGVRAGVPIRQIAFNITSRGSSGAFVNYTISMGNTTAGNLASGFISAPTTVFSSNHTTNSGWDSLTFSTPFVWDGTSNVVVDVCYGANSSSAGTNDLMQAIDNSPYTVTVMAGSNTGSGTGCSLGTSSASTSTVRPVMRFMQIVPPTAIETAASSTRTWTVKTGNEVYFYTPTADTSLIAGVNNSTADLGCVTATLTGAGNGFTSASFISGNRSRKEVTITPTTAGSTAGHNVYFYMTNTELAGVSPSILYLVRTTASTDAGINASNTVFLTPTVQTGTNYVAFMGNFTGFGRYFLTDNILCTPPTATITAGGSTTFCAGGSVVLSATTGTGYTYQWMNGGVDISGATASTYTATTSGVYQVRVTLSGCSATSSAITVTVSATYVASIVGVSGLCTGTSATFTDSTAGGTWSTSNASIASVNTTGTVFGVASGSAVISYTYTGSCGTLVRTASVTVSAPTTLPAITGTTSACPGAGSLLGNTVTSGVWSSSNPSVASVSTSGYVSAISSGTATISYTVTSGLGCVSTVTTTYTVLSITAATVTASGPTTICTGGTVTLSAPVATGLTYQWSNGGTNITGATNASFTTSSTGSYAVTISNATGCSLTSTAVTVTVSSSVYVVPSVLLTASPGTLVCSGAGAATFSATPVNGGSSPVYTWYVNGAVVSGVTSASYAYTPSNGDVVTCKLRSNASCVLPDTAMASLTMTVSAYVAPAVSIDAVPSDTMCEGVTAAFNAVPVNGGSSPSYVWNKNGVSVYTGPTYYYVPSNGDLLTVTMRSNYLCRSTDYATSPLYTVYVEPTVANTVTVMPSATTVVTGTTVTFTALAPNAGASPQYQWFVNGVAIVGATSSTYSTNRLTNGSVVTCRVTSSDRCSVPTIATAGAVTIYVTTGVEQTNALASNLSLVPNPNNGSFVITGTISAKNASVKVTNMLGQVVYTGSLHNTGNVVNESVALGNQIAAGVYIATVHSNDGAILQTFRVVVE